MLPNIHAQKYMRCAIGLGAAAAISGGAALAGGAVQAIANANLNDKNRRWQNVQAKKARQWQEDMYKKYNSPTAQVQQLAAAGINPYNDGAASTTPMGTSTSAPTSSPTPTDYGFIGEAGATIANTLLQKPAFEAQALANRETEVRIEGMLTDNRIKLYDEIMKAIEAGNYEYAQMLNNERVREDIRTSKASRKEKLQSRQNMEKEFEILVEEHKAKQRENRYGDGAEAAGVNPVIDAHNLSEATMNKIIQETQDNKSLASLNRMIMSERHQAELPVLHDLANKANISTQLYDLTGQDYSSLPPYLQTAGAVLVSMSNKPNDDMTLGQWREWKSKYTAAIDAYRKACEDWGTNSANKDNPNYQSDAEKTQLFYQLIDTMLKIPRLGFGDSK